MRCLVRVKQCTPGIKNNKARWWKSPGKGTTLNREEAHVYVQGTEDGLYLVGQLSHCRKTVVLEVLPDAG